MSDVNGGGGAETVRLVEKAGGEAHYIHCDVRDGAQVKALMDGAAERFGGIDVLHNNAGVHDTDLTGELTIETLSEEVWDKVYEINLKGVWLCTKHAVPHLRRRPGAAVVNAASIAGLVGYPMALAYCSTKGGVVQLTRATAIELAPDVRCNCYCPAAIDTPMIHKYLDAVEDREAVEKGHHRHPSRSAAGPGRGGRQARLLPRTMPRSSTEPPTSSTVAHSPGAA